MSKPRDVESRLREYEPSLPSPALRHRVLSRARSACSPPVSRVDLLWFSGPLRVAAAALAVALVVFSVLENRRLEGRLQSFFVEPPAARRQELSRISRELGIDPGLRGRILEARDAGTL